MSYILLLAGFALLIVGANYFVEGSAKIAAILRVSPMLIGLTVVAFGTSSPEATVSIIAALNDNAGVALGNVVGSNIFNASFIVGVTALVMAIRVQSETIRKEIPFTLLASVVLLVLICDTALQGNGVNLLTRGDGIVLLLFFAVFIYYILEAARKGRENVQPAEPQTQSDSTKGVTTADPAAGWGKNIGLSLGGLAAIIYGGHLVVTSSTDIALRWGMSEMLIGLTIVAVGTSLPELVTSVAAALKKQNDIAVGNIVGSNIFNILFVLGASAVISPLSVTGGIVTDVMVMIVLTIVLLVVSRTQYRIGRMEGLFLTLVYVGYTIYIIMRG